ncbi:MAG: T9SS type A sorting domain-containing protein [Chitinophagaceae bacterium]|nr:T9SS type A sorting domain-containing protein [Chitinophagaceae bacterium]MCW5915050.1 T9SS type A sorting domain-containing protein [Chitinophagaceae bacterium]
MKQCKMLLLGGLLFTGLTIEAQNVNIPNTDGPMGLQVNSYTGNLFFERLDFAIPDEGLDIAINFYYNSYNLGINRGFGNGWGFEYDMHYRIDSVNRVIVEWGNGREDEYTPTGGGNYQSPVGFFYVLKEYETGKFSLTEKTGLKYLFEDNTHKGLTKITDLNGNFISLGRTGTRITSITNNHGKTISLAYNGKGQLTTVTDAIISPSRSWSYAYDAQGNLTSVTDPLGAKEKYTYLLNGPVQTVSDKNLNVVDIVYFPGYGVKEMVGCNRRLSYSYDTAQLMTVITEYMESGENQVNKFYYSKIGKQIWLTAISSNCCGLNKKIDYDANGNKIKETDANGNTTSFSYDDIGNLLTITNALGQKVSLAYIPGTDWVSKITDSKGFVTSLEYDSKGNLTKVTDPDNRIFTAVYDANGKMTSGSTPDGKTFTFTYDANGNLSGVNGPEGFQVTLNVSQRGDILSITDANSHTGTLQYDILGRMTQLTDALSNKVNLSYDAIGNLVSFRNQNNEQSILKYDASNRIKAIESPHGSRLNIGYDGMDNITSITDAKGSVTSYQYDSRNLLKSALDADGNEVSFGYDRNGNLITANLPTGSTITYTYDPLNRLVSASDETGPIGSLEYDANGNISKFTEANGAATTYEYDKLDRLKKITDALGKSIEIAYNTNGTEKTIKDKMGKISTYNFDNLGRITSYSDNIGAVTQVGYDATGNITSLTDANGNVTVYTYDALSRVTKETFPDGKFTEYSYDVKGNITTYRAKDGSVANYTYDSLNRLITKTLPGGQVFTYGYDALGQIISATNNTGTVEFTYDNLGRVTSESFNGREVKYNYSVAGRTETTIYPDSTVVLSTYDTRNRLTSMRKNGDSLVTWQYNNADQVVSKSHANGLTSTYQYDFAGRLISIHTGSIQNMAFTYDDNGNITSIIRGTSNESEFFTYDNNSRLINYKKGKDGGPFTVNDTYTYDALGNRTAATIGGKSITYTKNNLNQTVSMNDGTKTTNFTYDNNGNLTFDGKYYKTYDQDKRLIRDSASVTEVIYYQYDALGRRAVKEVNGVASNFTHSGLNLIEERNAGDEIVNKTFFSGFLSPVMNEKDGIPFYYHQNHLLSVDALTDVGGDLVEKYQYDAYGKQTRYDANGNVLTGSITGNRYGYTGQQYDSATGHNQFYFRSYNPETGLFDQQDLIGYGDGMGMYQYVGNNPANGVDILGLEDCPPKVKTTTTTIVTKIGTANTYTGFVITVIETAKTREFRNTMEEITSRMEEFRKIEEELLKRNREIRQLFGKSSQQLSKGINAARNGRISTASKAPGAIAKNGKVMRATGMAGKASSALGVGVNAYNLGNAIAESDGSFNPEVGLATADLIGSGLAFVPGFGTVLGLGDLISVSLTGESINQHISNTSNTYFNTVINSTVEKEILKEELELIEYYKRIGKYDTYIKAKNKMRKKTRGTDCPQNNDPGGTQKRPPHSGGAGGTAETITSNDPNEIIGPEGQPDKRWVSVKDRLPYTVTFENDISASAPAKYVKVIVPAHEKMDVTTFQLTNLGFNNQDFALPSLANSTYQRLDARDSLGMFIDLVAGYDVTKNQFFWEFQSIDPVTMMAPEDPMKGFLLLQDTTEDKSRNGHGFVTFSVKPVADAQTLDSILAYADIVFDQNDTIPTNIEKNVIDAVAPTSHLNALNSSYEGSIPLSWSGVDDPNGCGVHYYSLYYSTDGTNFSLWKDRITRTDTTFTGPGDQRYYFFVIATDSVGNTEQMRVGDILNTYLSPIGVVPVSWLYFKGTNKGNDNLLEWATANERNTKEYVVERSFDAQDFKAIGSVRASGNTNSNASYHYTDYGIDKLGQPIMYYRLAQMDIDGRKEYSNVIRLNYDAITLVKTIVYPNPTKGLITVASTDKTLIGTIAQVYDEAGKLLQSVKITHASQQFDMSGYTNGIYFIRLANKEVLKVMKH